VVVSGVWEHYDIRIPRPQKECSALTVVTCSLPSTMRLTLTPNPGDRTA
jgi:hypothetical protein